MNIRKYKSKDRKQVERIHYLTCSYAKSDKNFLDNKKIWAYEAKYYLTKEPESIFVAEDKNKIVGYVFGCLNNKNHNEVFDFFFKIIRNIALLPFSSIKDRKFMMSQIKFAVRAITGKSKELKMPKTKGGHIHINLLPEVRGKGLGSKMLKEFFKYAKKNGTNTISAGTFEMRIGNNKNFWLKNGFKEIFRTKTSALKEYIPKEKINLVIYKKVLK